MLSLSQSPQLEEKGGNKDSKGNQCISGKWNGDSSTTVAYLENASPSALLR